MVAHLQVEEIEGPLSCGERIRMRVHGESGLPTLVYFPGIHGDWTLVGGLRLALQGRARFVEFCYPRTTQWSLEDYADAIETTLRAGGIEKAWVLAESFGSQVAWPFCSKPRRLEINGLLLAGGFGRYPVPLMARWGLWVGSRLPMRWIQDLLKIYGWVARLRFGRDRERLAEIGEFLERRTAADRDAAMHRLQLICANDPVPLAACIQAPVYYLTGLWDPVVPWPFVPAWLRRHCPGFRAWSIVCLADHNVLGSGSKAAAERILNWIDEGCRPGASHPPT